MRGCYLYHKRVGGDKVDSVEAEAEADAEQGTSITPAHGQSYNTSVSMKSSNSHERPDVRQPAGKWAFIFQTIFQVTSPKTTLFHGLLHISI